MTLIYEPRGKAREYSPLALNIYRGCDHGCEYCYVPSIFARNAGYVHGDVTPREGVIAKLQRELKNGAPDKQILLSFTGDPYCNADVSMGLTREALIHLELAGGLVAILTKGGTRCLRDEDIFQHFVQDSDGAIKVGATLTFLDPKNSERFEPHAAIPEDRIDALAELHRQRIPTWASIEPVIDPAESLAVIRASIPFVDAYKIGKLNHRPSDTDWANFLREAVAIMRANGKPFYIKKDLQKFKPPDLELSDAECDQDALALTRKPTKQASLI